MTPSGKSDSIARREIYWKMENALYWLKEADRKGNIDWWWDNEYSMALLACELLTRVDIIPVEYQGILEIHYGD